MKHFFLNLFKKVKAFFVKIALKTKKAYNNLTSAKKLKYIIVITLTVAVCASIIMVAALNVGKSQTPTDPKDFVEDETNTIDFDNEIIFDIGEESSSVDTEDTVPNTSETSTDEATEEVSTEESTSTENTLDTEPAEPQDPDTEPMYTDTSVEHEENVDYGEGYENYEGNYNNDPVETPSYQPSYDPETSATTSQQTSSKPAETTTKAPETQPKPIETTKAPETEPKSTETHSKPETNPSMGQFIVKDKKYDYNGNDVAILEVENKSQQAYTITITGKFKDSSGKVLKMESKTFEGFPAGWKNNFVYQPGIKYSSVSWELKAVDFSDDTVAQYLHHGNTVSITTNLGFSDGSGKYIYPSAENPFDTLTQYVSVFVHYKWIYVENIEMLNFSSELVLLDEKGNINSIVTPGKKLNFDRKKEDQYSNSFPLFVTDVLWENKEEYKLPSAFQSFTGIVSITSVSG